jgi:hypothetical protein
MMTPIAACKQAGRLRKDDVDDRASQHRFDAAAVQRGAHTTSILRYNELQLRQGRI